MNMIWRIRHKKRQPGFVHAGGTDHPDRNRGVPGAVNAGLGRTFALYYRSSSLFHIH
jgi:hypothetical protein